MITSYTDLESIHPNIQILTKAHIESLVKALSELDKDYDITQKWLQDTYKSLVVNRTITEKDTPATIAGFIAVTVQFKHSPIPIMSTTQWAITQDILDDQDRPGSYFFDYVRNYLNNHER